MSLRVFDSNQNFDEILSHAAKCRYGTEKPDLKDRMSGFKPSGLGIKDKKSGQTTPSKAPSSNLTGQYETTKQATSPITHIPITPKEDRTGDNEELNQAEGVDIAL
jgi:hypothetical protein